MDIDRTGWLKEAARIISPNYDARPEGMEPDLIVIHNISLPAGKFGGDEINQLFTNTLRPTKNIGASIATLRVSAHALVRRTGEIVQYVAFSERAWHAGDSHFNMRKYCNDFSIGIELEGTDQIPYESAQYTSLGRLIDTLCAHWPGITAERITGHRDIAPHRKTDPGPAFRWEQLFAAMHSPPDPNFVQDRIQ